MSPVTPSDQALHSSPEKMKDRMSVSYKFLRLLFKGAWRDFLFWRETRLPHQDRPGPGQNTKYRHIFTGSVFLFYVPFVNLSEAGVKNSSVLSRLTGFDRRMVICFYGFMKTTVVLPDAIFRRVKVETATHGRTLRAFILEAVVHELEGDAGRASHRRRVKLPLVPSRHPGSLRITADTIASALLEEDVRALA
jgi:hypothetical protein